MSVELISICTLVWSNQLTTARIVQLLNRDHQLDGAQVSSAAILRARRLARRDPIRQQSFQDSSWSSATAKRAAGQFALIS
jgi:hypothetical protein